MAGTLTVDTIQSDTSYSSTISIPSKVNFTGGMQVGGVDLSPSGFRNKIINGDVRINQRGNTISYVTNTSGIVFPADRMRIENGTQSSNISVSQSAVVPDGFSNSICFTVVTANTSLPASGHIQLAHYIEGYDVVDFAWGTSSAKPITLSFWVRGSQTGVYPVTFSNDGNPGGADMQYASSYTINTANTWEYKTITVTGPTTGTWAKTTGIGLGIRMGPAYGSTYSNCPAPNTWRTTAASTFTNSFVTHTNNFISTVGATLYFAGLQVEKGSTATPFEQRPYGKELALCQRYYQKLSGQYSKVGIAYGSSSTRVVSHFFLRTSMRTDPSVRISSTTDFRVNDAGANRTSTNLQVNTYGTRNDLVGLWTDVASGITTGATYEVDIGTTTGWFAFDSEY